MTLAAGSRLGSYEIVAPIGAGGMGEVYRARDTKLGREIAIKVLPDETASDPGRRQRFEQEARSASALNHPNILTIYDIGTTDGTVYIAMELVEGKTLRELVASGEALPTRKLLDVATQTAEGLAKAHSAGIVHRDLKPENLMVSRDGFVKILDFGLAKLTEPVSQEASVLPTAVASPTQPGTVMGTAGYMSPSRRPGRAWIFAPTSSPWVPSSTRWLPASGRFKGRRARRHSWRSFAKNRSRWHRRPRRPPPRSAGSWSAASPRIPRSATRQPRTSRGT